MEIEKNKFIFFGSPEFAAIVLSRLISAGFMPQAVVCNPDKPFGRKKIIAPPPVKSLILNHETWNIPVLQPEKFNDDFKLHVFGFKPKFAVVAAYAQIIPQEIISGFKLGVIGVHPSILPKYRGPSPIQSAILNGNETAGVTLYMLDERMDHGPVLSSGELRTDNRQTYLELQKSLAELGGELLAKTLPAFLAGKIKPVSQNEADATYTKKISTDEAFVAHGDLEKAMIGDGNLSILIDRKIRAFNPEPGCWTVKNCKRIKLLKSKIENGKLVLLEIQMEGKNPQTLGL